MIKSKKLISQVDRPAPDTLERANLYRFEKNERTTLFNSDEFDRMMQTIKPFDLVAYSELEPFYNSVCKFLNIDRKELLITSGSDQGIKSVYETFINESDEVINYTPNYAMFSVYAKMFGAKEVVKNYNKQLGIDIGELISSINEATKLIVISNPGHNGVTVPKVDIIRVLEYTRNFQTIVLVDEAYVDFSTVDMLGHINTYKNLLIVRTMSKAYGIASLRIGFLIGCSEIIAELYRVKPVHEIDGIAAKIGQYLIEHSYIKDQFVNNVNAGKKLLELRLTEMGMEVLPSDTNFVYFKLNRSLQPESVVEDLMKKNIYIKSPLGVDPFKGYLRTTVGDTEQMDHFCSELSKTLTRLGTN
jgi:histidinol-phosphate aminotransferase